MSEFLEWPTITDLRHLLTRVKRDQTLNGIARRDESGIVFTPKIKLHGANHGIIITKNSFSMQSRTTVLKEGQKGFAAFVNSNAEFFSNLFDLVSKTHSQLASTLIDSKKFTVFGEYCGPGIQKGSDVAIGKIKECIFCVFGIAFQTSQDEDVQILVDPDMILEVLGGKDSLPTRVYVIPWFTQWKKTLDVVYNRNLSERAHEIDELVEQIDHIDPWVAETFGIQSPGEGLVWYPTSLCSSNGVISSQLFGDLSFKTKGLTHQMIQQSKSQQQQKHAPSCIDAVAIARSPEDFALMFCSRTRLLQGLTESCPEFNESELDKFVSWMIKDIHKEGNIELEESQLRWEEIDPFINKISSEWFTKQLESKLSLSSSSQPTTKTTSESTSSTLPFKQMLFCFSESVSFKAKGDLSKKIKENGGQVLFTFSQKCTHLIAAQTDLKPSVSSRVEKALSTSGVFVVTEQFVLDCIGKGTHLNENQYNATFSEQKATPSSSKEEVPRKRVVERPTVWNFGSGNEPKFSTNFDISRSIVLQATNIHSKNTNKFYAIELHTSREAFGQGFIYRIFTQHGRTDELASGKKGVCESRYLQTLDDAEEIFDDIAKSKLEDGEYSQVDLVSVSNLIGSRAALGISSTESTSVFVSESKLPESVQSIVRFLFEKASSAVAKSVSCTVTRKGIETPLGITTLQQIEKAQQVLSSISLILEQPITSKSELEKLSGDFFSLIPAILGKQKRQTQLAVIDTQEKLREKEDLLDLMRDLANITKRHNPEISEIDEMYQSIGCSIVPLDKNSNVYKQLELRFISGSLHDQKPNPKGQQQTTAKQVRVMNIFKVAKKSEQIPFSNVCETVCKEISPFLLWHSSKVENFLGLLSHGILTPLALAQSRRTPLAKRTDFGFLGAGIYFNDSSLASVKYAGNGTRLLMLGVSVACGKTAEFTQVQPGLISAPTGYHSCHGVARNPPKVISDFENDEYVIYDNSSQKLEFLIEFEI